ncbi:glycoside hydrolase family 140 protein [Haoranjiania flava]|uniref:Glycoside hydrolase family 140 protein n=1 Tax=Haoranjiania flava TaxID=1856322 RepID=A0AAE3IMU1_9BACT|nr:glycoside hydrolase family 140 protein [Haoranjiania flava]MCU7694794.1 glycoside hydrolase family 140 protein [Haoranjiania flava]
MKSLLTLLLIHSTIFFSAAQQLKISGNGRYIESQDGKPFLWIGDTAWELFHKLSREEASEYLETRARQGFTVIQAVVLAENDGLRIPNAYGDLPLIGLSPEKPNERYFMHVDFIVNKAASLGLYIAMLPTWADKVPSNRPEPGPVVFNRHNASSFGEFLGNRYKKQPVIWILGGDRDVQDQEVFEIWKAMALGLKKGDGGRHLITYHPAGESSSSYWFHNEDWLDFNMYQSGHAHHYMPVYQFAEEDWLKKPAKPFIDGEPAYEDIPVRFWVYMDWNEPAKKKKILDKQGLVKDKSYFPEGFFTDYDVRVHAYWNFLSGACGYTYGNNAVWQMFKKNNAFSIPALTDWKEALTRPGAEDMQYLKKLFELRPFSKLVPDQSIIYGKNPRDSTHIRSAKAEDGSFFIVYLPIGGPVKINMKKISGRLITAWWYNPRNGKAEKIIKTTKEDIQEFISPGAGKGNDWVLVLDDRNARLKTLEM